ncbi:uncharacterized protein EAF02_007282 [Botrytis sinoallii]|uniref:uncharacterized protein n=1 Tax=Botrytis sinoallii TaxID=1463999 RepID=UPI0019021116|nr:uncharacterized protein EAF02_007282 [Botrytis sinoallii]KAF7880436.1 hypothetical protein EAF02_007282 [Botrytis sinoallii]
MDVVLSLHLSQYCRENLSTDHATPERPKNRYCNSSAECGHRLTYSRIMQKLINEVARELYHSEYSGQLSRSRTTLGGVRKQFPRPYTLVAALD